MSNAQKLIHDFVESMRIEDFLDGEIPHPRYSTLRLLRTKALNATVTDPLMDHVNSCAICTFTFTGMEPIGMTEVSDE